MKFFIYSLSKDDHIVYVGVTTNPDQRIKNHHIQGASFAVLEEVDELTYQQAERRWIISLRSSGEPLLNQTNGGQRMRLGPRSPNWSDESRAKMSARFKGTTHTVTVETADKISQAKRGKPFSEEHREAISAALKGKPKPPFSAEHKANIRAAAFRREEARRSKRTLVDVPVPTKREE